MPGRCPCWRACCAASTWGVCYSALTRKSDIPFHGIANCAPAKGGVWPVLAPAGAFVRAGVWRRGAVFLLRRCMFGSRLLFAAQRQTGRLAICFVFVPPWVGIAGSAFSRRGGVIGLDWFIWGLCVSLRRSRRGTRGRGKRSRRRASVVRFYWNVLRLSHACCLLLSAKQDGLRNAPFLFPRGSGSPVVRSHGGVGLSGWIGSFGDCAFLCGDPDGGRGDDRSSPIRKRNAVLRWRSF